MAQVVVEVNGRPYTMQCPDGEEAHLQELAKLLDGEVALIRQNVGAVGDIRLLVMSGLMVADRLSEAIRRIETLEDEVRSLRKACADALTETRMLEVQVADRLTTATELLHVAARELA
jgi:cell division protein ZapA